MAMITVIKRDGSNKEHERVNLFPIANIENKKQNLDGWDITVTLPLSEKEHIEQGYLIESETKEDGIQTFVIHNYEYDRYSVELTAYHVLYETKDYMIEELSLENVTVTNAIRAMNNNLDKPSPYTISGESDKIVDVDIFAQTYMDAMKELLGETGSYIKADRYNITISDSSGRDTGESITYGKNLYNFKYREDFDNVITKIYPFFLIDEERITLEGPEKYIQSEYEYNKPYTRAIQFEPRVPTHKEPIKYADGKVEENPPLDIEELRKDLRRQARSYLNISELPKISYHISSTLNVDFAIGDIIHFKHPAITKAVPLKGEDIDNLSIPIEVYSYEYDVISGTISAITYGDLESTPYDKIKNFATEIVLDKTQSLTDFMTNNLDLKDILDRVSSNIEVDLANKQEDLNELAEVIGSLNKSGHLIIYDNELYALDRLPIENANNVLNLGQGGLTFSTNGVNGPWNAAISIDGKINASQILTGELDASIIKTNTISADALTLEAKKSIVAMTEDRFLEIDEDILDLKNRRTWYAYATNMHGNNMTTTPQEDSNFMGTYYGSERSDDPTDYVWVEYKGEPGRGIQSSYVEYALTDSGTEIPESKLDWSTDLPELEYGKYFWTKGVTVYTDSTTSETHSVSYIPHPGNGITESEVEYSEGDDGINPPEANWVTSPIEVDYGKYLWTRTKMRLDDGTEIFTYQTSYKARDGVDGVDGETTYTHFRYAEDSTGKGMHKDPSPSRKYIGVSTSNSNTPSAHPSDYSWSKYAGDDGAQGISVIKVTNYYMNSTNNSSVTHTTSGWTSASPFPSPTETKPYLWNYEEVSYSDGSTTKTDPVLVGNFSKDGGKGEDGRGISKIEEFYATNNSSTNVPTSGWGKTPTPTTNSNRYLWNYELITYTSGRPITVDTPKRIIGTHGDKGETGPRGPAGSNASTLDIVATTQVMKVAKDNTITPNAVDFTLNLQNLSGTATWTTSPTVDLTGTGNEKRLTAANMGNRDSVTVTASLGGVSDSITIIRLHEGKDGLKGDKGDKGVTGSTGGKGDKGDSGEDAFTVSLTNESHTFPSSYGGEVSEESYDLGRTEVRVYQGTSLLEAQDNNATTSGLTDNKYRVTSITSSGIAISRRIRSTKQIQLTPSDMISDGAKVSITIVARVGGKNTTFTKELVYSKSKEGRAGASLYTWIRYADTPTTGISEFPEGKQWKGLAYNKDVPSIEGSDNYNDYQWYPHVEEIDIPGGNLLLDTGKYEYKDPTNELEYVEWEVGDINISGVDVGNNNRLRTVDYIPVIPNATYRISASTAVYAVHEYNEDQSSIGRINIASTNKTFTTSTDTELVRVTFNQTNADPSTVDGVGIKLQLLDIATSVQDFGGRNLILGSAEPIVLPPRDTGNAGDNYNYLRIKAPMIKDETYTLSFNVEITDGDFDKVSIYTQYGNTGTVIVDLVNGRGVHTFTAVADTDTENIFIYAGLAGDTRGNGMILHEYKLEKGNVSTDWTPAPEDLTYAKQYTLSQPIQPHKEYTLSLDTNKEWVGAWLGRDYFAGYVRDGELRVVDNRNDNLMQVPIPSFASNHSIHHPVEIEELEVGRIRIRRAFPEGVTSTVLSLFSLQYNVEEAGTYTYSADVKPEKSMNLALTSGTYVTCPAGVWTRIVSTREMDNNRHSVIMTNYTYSSSDNPWIEVKNYKLEKGSVATPYISHDDTRDTLILKALDEDTVIEQQQLEPGTRATSYYPNYEDIVRWTERLTNITTKQLGDSFSRTISAQTTAMEANFSALNNRADQLDKEVEDIDEMKNAIDDNKGIITEVKEQVSTFNQTITGFSSEYSKKIDDLQGDITEFSSFLDWDGDAKTLTIGASDSPIQMKLDNESLRFESGNVHSKFTSDGMYNKRWSNDAHSIEYYNESQIRGTIWRSIKE